MRNLFIFLVLTLCFTSCETTEKIYFHEDESVTYAYETDLSNLLISGLDQEMNTDFKNKLPIDTTFTFGELIKDKDIDSINYKEELEEIFKDFKINLKMNEEDGFISFFTKQKNVNDLNLSLEQLSSNFLKYKEGYEDELGKYNILCDLMNRKSVFKLKNNYFERKSYIITNANDVVKNEKSEDIEFLGIFGLNNLNIEYHFPKPVKSISDSTVKLSWDRKTVYIEKSIDDLMNKPNILNISIELED